MTLTLVRVDDRLIHGQVVEGWLRVIQAQRILVVSDRAAKDPLQSGMMRLAVPENIALEVVSVDRALERVKAAAKSRERVLLLIAEISELDRLLAAGASIAAVNLGGVHAGPGRSPAAARGRPSLSDGAAARLCFTDEEKRAVAGWIARGVSVETRALPTDERVGFDALFPAAPKAG